MGRNLALNIAEHGFRPVVYDRDPEVAAAVPGQNVATLGALAEALARPRRILLMVKAGQPVDDVIDSLRAHLEPGDVIIDGGNSHWMDTPRRAEALADDGIMLLGAGISGGEEGARHGPAIMVGGDERAWQIVAPVLRAIAADVGGEPCCCRFGPGGVGHFVKIVHNGIEYAVMQAIAETWIMLRDLAGLEAAEASAVFARWNDGLLGSYLMEITADILATPDTLADGALIDKVDNVAGHKDTGRWTGEAAMALGVATPVLLAGFFARGISADISVRAAAHHSAAGAADVALDDLQAALGGNGDHGLQRRLPFATGGMAGLRLGARARDGRPRLARWLHPAGTSARAHCRGIRGIARLVVPRCRYGARYRRSRERLAANGDAGRRPGRFPAHHVGRLGRL